MATQIELERLLAIPGIESVTVVGNHNLIAMVVSSLFSYQDEALRHENVWKYLSDRFRSSELKNVESLFTNTPEEHAALSSPSSVA